MKFALRQLLKSPGFTLVALLTLALGIGANTAIFSLVNAVILRPLPFPRPEQLMLVWCNNTREKIPDDITSWPTFNDWRTQNRTFSSMAGYSAGNMNLTGNGEPEQIPGCTVGDKFFESLGVSPLLGRWFSDDEQVEGKDAVVIIGHGLWQRRFGGDPAVIGKDIQIGGRPRTIVGVMPPGFAFPAKTDAYIPIAPTPQRRAGRNSFWLPVMGRLKPGVTVAEAQADLLAITQNVIRANPGQEGYLVNVVGLHAWTVRHVRTALWVLLGAVGCVLLIGCANLANLLLARGVSRRREIAVRIALGASRGQIVRQLLAESALLAVGGGGLGVLLGIWGLDAIKAFAGATLPQFALIRIDPAVLAVTAAVSVLCGLGFGLLPAWQASRTNPHDALKDGGRGSSVSRSAQLTRGALVIAQTALAVVLLVGAGLLLRSFWKLSQVETGLHGDQLVSLPLNLPRAKYNDGPKTAAFHAQLEEKLASLPGVQSAALTSSILLERLHNSGIFTIEGQPTPPDGHRLELPIDSASPGYFATMKIPLVEGRMFNASDVQGGAQVALINETMAHMFWPHQSPLGRRFLFGNPPPPDAKDANGQPRLPNWITIVGVVKDTRRQGADRAIRIESWLPMAQNPSRRFLVIVRTALSPAVIARSLREAVWSIDRDLPVPRIAPVTELIDATTAQRRLNLSLLAAFAGLALVLAALGLYGVVAYSVTQRTGEFGIRFALGARPSDVLRLVLGQATRLVAIGLLVGLIGALALGRVVESLLFGVNAYDGATYAGVILVLGAAALVAAWLPARRAAKVDPMSALRTE
jgi:putative ABC transport system permease protein